MVARRADQSGQAVTEYIMLVAILTSMFLLLMRMLGDKAIAMHWITPIQKDFVAAYKYGHPQASGYDEPQGPYKHPRAAEGGTNYRIFFNPNFLLQS